VLFAIFCGVLLGHFYPETEARALTNLIGNGVATVVVSKWENELDREKLTRMMASDRVEEDLEEEARLPHRTAKAA